MGRRGKSGLGQQDSNIIKFVFNGVSNAERINSPQFFFNYASIVISMFIKACRTLPELEYLCQRHYAAFRDPVVRGDVEQHNVRALYR